MKNKEPESSILPSKVGGMTLQECKDHVAISYGFRNWSEINFYEIGERLAQVDAPFDEEIIFDEAADLYASQFRKTLGRQNVAIINHLCDNAKLSDRIKELETELSQFKSTSSPLNPSVLEKLKGL